MSTFNDRPVHHLQDDALHFADYAPALKTIITTGDTPLTVGVFGAWGSGKSSLLRMLRNAVEGDQRYPVRTVWFTAWKYDRQEALWRTLILRVLEAMYPRQPGEGSREEREILDAEEGSREAQLIETLDRLAEAVYQPVSWDEVGPRDVKWWQLISNVGGASVDTVATLASAGMWPKVKEMLGGDGAPADEIKAAAEAISKSVIQQQQRQLKYMEEFEERFAEAIRLLGHDAARLIVFVDDLDRCLPEKAIEVLEAIKLFLEVEGAVFVLGMDQEIIRRGIEARYGELFRQRVEKGGDLPIGGDLYLQKIVQIPFHQHARGNLVTGASCGAGAIFDCYSTTATTPAPGTATTTHPTTATTMSASGWWCVVPHLISFPIKDSPYNGRPPSPGVCTLRPGQPVAGAAPGRLPHHRQPLPVRPGMNDPAYNAAPAEDRLGVLARGPAMAKVKGPFMGRRLLGRRFHRWPSAGRASAAAPAHIHTVHRCLTLSSHPITTCAVGQDGFLSGPVNWAN